MYVGVEISEEYTIGFGRVKLCDCKHGTLTAPDVHSMNFQSAAGTGMQQAHTKLTYTP